MSFGPRVVMPGAFHLEAPNGAPAPIGGAHTGLFRPPATSPSTSSSLYLSGYNEDPSNGAATPSSNVKRKRRNVVGSKSTPMDRGTLYTRGNTADISWEGTGGSARCDVRYTLAGQIETPSVEAQRQLGHMTESTYSDVGYRRDLGSKRPREHYDTPPSSEVDPQAVAGWSRFALDTIGGVVGKVWNFCTEGAFRGFYAGGSRGYEIQPPAAGGREWSNEQDTLTALEIPGHFPESDYAPFHYERETPESTPPPAAKRRQVCDDSPRDELRKNWVMVNEQKAQSGYSSPKPSTPVPSRPSFNRRISKPVSRLSNPGFARQHSHRISHAGAANLTNRQPASFASSRSPVENHRPTTPSRLPIPTAYRSPSTLSPRLSQQPSRIPSPSPNSPRGHRRTHSTASAVSTTPVANGWTKRRESSAHELVQESSPRLDLEARNMVAKRMKQEQQTDARINDFNTRLMDMIRQGKEALGTTVEVEDHHDFDTGDFDPWEDD